LFNAFRGCACATTLTMAVAHALRLTAPAHLITSSSFDGTSLKKFRGGVYGRDCELHPVAARALRHSDLGQLIQRRSPKRHPQGR
jgi:hypothetical protein